MNLTLDDAIWRFVPVRRLRFNTGVWSVEVIPQNTEDEVKDYFKLFGMLDHNVKFVKGMFKDTIHQSGKRARR